MNEFSVESVRDDAAAISVLIPCYRCAETITRAVDSVFKQTMQPAEVILIDDFSGDNTIEILRSLKSQYGDWVRLVELSQNVGAGSARNAGWDLATQPYIAFLDSDDGWHQRKLEVQYEFMRNNPHVVLSGHLCRELRDDCNDSMDWVVELKSINAVSGCQLLLRNKFLTPSVMMKRDVPFRFIEGRRHMEDHLLWLEIIRSNLKVVNLNIELATTFKAPYGASGLSSSLWLMEKGDLQNYLYLYRKAKLSIYQCAFLQCFSLIKFAKRLLVVYLVRPILCWITSPR